LRGNADFIHQITIAPRIQRTDNTFKTPLKRKFKLVSLTLILSGAIGNLIDRIANGFVVDFIDFHYQSFIHH
jgi:lipoprotein signal peptidase